MSELIRTGTGTLGCLFVRLDRGSGGEGNVWDIVTDEGNAMTEVSLPVRPQPELWVLREPLRKGQTVPEAGEDWEDHPPPGVSEDLRNVPSLAQTEPFLVRAAPEDRCSEGLQGSSVEEDEVDVITWTWWSVSLISHINYNLPSSEHRDILNIADTKNRNKI